MIQYAVHSIWCEYSLDSNETQLQNTQQNTQWKKFYTSLFAISILCVSLLFLNPQSTILHEIKKNLKKSSINVHTNILLIYLLAILFGFLFYLFKNKLWNIVYWLQQISSSPFATSNNQRNNSRTIQRIFYICSMQSCSLSLLHSTDYMLHKLPIL